MLLYYDFDIVHTAIILLKCKAYIYCIFSTYHLITITNFTIKDSYAFDLYKFSCTWQASSNTETIVTYNKQTLVG